MATLGQEMKNLRLELQEHPVNAVEWNPRTKDPNNKGRQNATGFATTAAQMDIPQVGAARRYETKNWNEPKTKERLRKKSPLLRTTTKNEDQTMDQNNGLEAKVPNEVIRTTLMTDLREFSPQLIKIFLPNQTSHMGTTIRKTEDHMINAQVTHSIEALEIDLKMGFSTIRSETGATMEVILVLQRLKGETSHKINHIANQEVINRAILLSADLIIDLRLVLHLMNKNLHKTITRRHLM